MKVIISIFTLILFSTAAQSKCEDEKKRVDKLNDILKYKVNEWAREQHRKAKQEFLECLRKPAADPQTTPPIFSEEPISYTATPSYTPTKRYKKTNNVTVSDYTNFKGKKKKAWDSYFTESPECLNNSNNMPIFVACAKVRKQFLNLFNKRWNEKTEELMPLLDVERSDER